MCKSDKEMWRFIAITLLAWGIVNFAVVAIAWWGTLSSGLSINWSLYTAVIAANVVVIIMPALIIFMRLRVIALHQAKEAHMVPHEVPLSLYEHPLQE